MNIGVNKAPLSQEVLTAIDAFMHEWRRDNTPVVISEAADAVQRVFPGHTLPTAELSNAIALAAIATQHCVYFDRKTAPDAMSESARLDDDGGSDLRPQAT